MVTEEEPAHFACNFSSEREREGDLLRCTHDSLWEHSSHDRLMERASPVCLLFSLVYNFSVPESRFVSCLPR